MRESSCQLPETQIRSLKGKRISIVGYGSQGRAQALNLRDSGFTPTIGVRSGRSRDLAQGDGFLTTSIAEAVSRADIVMLLVPDEVHAEVCREHVITNMAKGARLGFACGLTVHFKLVSLPPDCAFFLVAPKGPGELLRKRYLEGDGIPALVAASDTESLDVAKGYAHAIGCGRAGIVETTFREEAVADLFGEQCVLAGGLIELMKAAFRVLTERGYSPEVAYIECIAEVEYMASLMNRVGLKDLGRYISSTAYFGGKTRGKRLIGEGVAREMRAILEEIESGAFLNDFKAYLEKPEPGVRDKVVEGIEKARKNLAQGFER